MSDTSTDIFQMNRQKKKNQMKQVYKKKYKAGNGDRRNVTLQRSPGDPFHLEVPGLGEVACFGEERKQKATEAIVHVEAYALVLNIRASTATTITETSKRRSRQHGRKGDYLGQVRKPKNGQCA